MAERGVVPLALVFNRVNPILAQGAAFGGVAMVDRFAEGDVTELIRTGDCQVYRSQAALAADVPLAV